MWTSKVHKTELSSFLIVFSSSWTLTSCRIYEKRLTEKPRNFKIGSDHGTRPGLVLENMPVKLTFIACIWITSV